MLLLKLMSLKSKILKDIKKMIYSDYYFSYQINVFNDLGYILKGVNDSVWFWYWFFYTNTVESL